MEKILLAIDGTNLNPQALQFACYLAGNEHASVTGMFLENLVANEHPELEEANGMAYITWAVDRDSDEYKTKMEAIEKNISYFKDTCEKKGVRFEVKRDEGEPAADIIRNSRYSDVIITDAETSFNKRFEGVPTTFVKDILKDAECPVIIAPESFDGIEEIIFTYDGSRSSMFAIKQFTYLFPSFEDTKATVLEVNEAGQIYAPEVVQLQDWLSGHYIENHFEVLKGDPESELLAYLLKSRKTITVMGSYGRSSLSRIFKQSHADALIKVMTQAIFIAHL